MKAWWEDIPNAAFVDLIGYDRPDQDADWWDDRDQQDDLFEQGYYDFEDAA